MMDKDRSEPAKTAVAGQLERGVRRPAPKRAEDPHAEGWQALVLAGETIARSPLCGPEQAREFCAAVDRLSAALMREEKPFDCLNHGELWSFLRSVLSQGADIRCDYEAGRHKGYEAYSARLDAAASERADQLWERLKTPN